MSEVTKNSEKGTSRQARCSFSEWLLIYYTTSFYIDVEVVRRRHTSHPRQFSMIALIESPRGVSISSSSSSLLLFSPDASIQQHTSCQTRSLSLSQTDFFMKLVYLTVYLYVRFSFSSLAHLNLPICTGNLGSFSCIHNIHMTFALSSQAQLLPPWCQGWGLMVTSKY